MQSLWSETMQSVRSTLPAALERLAALEHDETVRTIALIVFLTLVLMLMRRPRGFRGSTYRRNWSRRRTPADPPGTGPVVLIEDDPAPGASWRNAVNLSDPVAQVDAVANCDFERIPLLNREEARLLPLLEHVVKTVGDGHRLMAQTSLGELIRPAEGKGTPESRRRGYASINSKRLDFAVINRFGYLVVAIEYQGSGHYHSQSFIRDAVKREALRKAGVEVLLIPEGFNHDEVRARLLALLSAGPSPIRTVS